MKAQMKVNQWVLAGATGGLDISGCTGDVLWPDLPECTALHCNSCTGLTSLPALPECTALYCDNCTGLPTKDLTS